MKKGDRRGVMIALAIMVMWSVNLWVGLHWEIDFAHPVTYLLFLLQVHLYTGLFITAHDAMHSVVSPNKTLNRRIGELCALLFAFNRYGKLLGKHHQHHRYVATDQDPDYHEGGFWPWYFSFVTQYVTLWQILFMAITFNLLGLWIPKPNALLYWAAPSVLSTFQLFYFGTYLPHKGEHKADNIHKSRSLTLNHWWAFWSCYFFGYHYEHHDSPNTPWWKLYQVKERQSQS